MGRHSVQSGHMSSNYEAILESIARTPRRWLITGCTGFIGSHLLAALLEAGQHVTGLDDFSSGKQENLDAVLAQVGEQSWARFRLIKGDIRDASACRDACRDTDIVVHLAAMVSVPLSLQEPDRCQSINVDGFLSVLDAARAAGVQRIVYASSSAVYGDSSEMPLREDGVVQPTSPYGASKLADESHAQAFSRDSGIATVGLRYFNVFGPRQDADGGYAAVIPKWIAASLRREPCKIHGDGSSTRDFCHVANVIQANVLAAMVPMHGSHIFNVGLGSCMSLNELSAIIVSHLHAVSPADEHPNPVHGPTRLGDIVHSQADVSKIRSQLGFEPTVSVSEGIEQLMRMRTSGIL